MSFYTLSDGSQPVGTTEFSVSTPIEAIPDNTRLDAIIEDIKSDEYNGEKHLKFTWLVLDGEYKGRKVFQKVRIFDLDPAKKDRAIRMLTAIDYICGGHVIGSGRQMAAEEMERHLCNKPMVIIVQTWDFNGKTGNWVNAVSTNVNPNQQTAPTQQTAPVPPLTPVPPVSSYTSIDF